MSTCRKSRRNNRFYEEEKEKGHGKINHRRKSLREMEMSCIDSNSLGDKE